MITPRDIQICFSIGEGIALQPKLGKVLPAKKVARYLQIENKIRAVVKYEVADGVPLVP